MNHTNATREAGAIVGLAFHSLQKYDDPADESRHDAYVLDYVRKAVLRQLTEDGVTISTLFDPQTGKKLCPTK